MNSTGAQPERRKELRQALRDADLVKFKKIIKDMGKDSRSDNELKRIKEFKQYVINNWIGIEIYKTGNCGGSSTEAHVSHVLSARMSSRPMGWSREGLKYMAELRAFCANGGTVGVEHLISKGRVPGIVRKAMKRAQRLFHAITQETLGNLAAIKTGKVTPISKILRSIQYGGLVTR